MKKYSTDEENIADTSRQDKSSESYLNELLEAMEAVRSGDLKVRVKRTGPGIYKELATSFNAMVAMIGGLAGEVSRVAREVGTEGKLFFF